LKPAAYNRGRRANLQSTARRAIDARRGLYEVILMKE